MGTFNKQLIAQTIARTTFEFEDSQYVLATLELSDYRRAAQILSEADDPFMEIIRDTSEVSVMVTEDTWEQMFVPVFGDRPKLAPLTRIFCNVDETCTGYLMTILERLSPNDVGIYVQGAYVTDHIFIHSEDVDKTKGLITKLQEDMRKVVS
ncbi:MAG TPA: hypothetical protein VL737_01835 [Candidatus Pristimantibacillus sp.]|jgi:hypothetical protein|nr:hypothetical protein [Candidatus Pristimantibacillus sp.]